VLVHGSASDYRTWRHQIGTLEKGFLAVAYSRRYHWPNEPIAPGADYSMQEHVDDLEALVDDLGLSPVRLVGHS
jgi:pimeloyl-ACP methyl ester carboxylesterase